MNCVRLGLIADSHIPEARPELWPEVFAAFAGVDAILHAGDIYDLAVIDALHEVAPVWAVRGNGDDGSGGRPVQPEHLRLRPTWVLEFGGLTIGMVHDMPIIETVSNEQARASITRSFGEQRLDVLVYGDTHVEAIDEIDGILCVNPGSPTYPHNLNVQYGTIGFLDIIDGHASGSVWRLYDGGIQPYDWSTWRRPR